MNVMSSKTIIDIYFQDVKDFLFCAIVVIITNYAAAQKKTTVTGDITLVPRLSPKTDPPNSKFLRLCNTPRLPPLCPFEVL
jgi:hypothetical protein